MTPAVNKFYSMTPQNKKEFFSAPLTLKEKKLNKLEYWKVAQYILEIIKALLNTYYSCICNF